TTATWHPAARSCSSRPVRSPSRPSAPPRSRAPTRARQNLSEMRGLSVLAAALVALALVTSAAFAKGGRGDESMGFGYGKNVRYGRALGYCNAFQDRETRYAACLSDALFSLVKGRNSATEVPKIDDYVSHLTGYLPAHCHVLMHSVGRRYAAS